MTSPREELRKIAVAWCEQDPDPQTKVELEGLIEGHNAGSTEATEMLNHLFSGRLKFGTAGIRGPLQAGPMGMNRVVIAQTTAGLAGYLLTHVTANAHRKIRVVVGGDARTNSAIFAADTASVLTGYGIEAILLPKELPTPVLAFAVRSLEADAGVMVTASHNPPKDNGYKVYLGGMDGGSQIIPPVDNDIEARIIEVSKTLVWGEIPRSHGTIAHAKSDIVARYVAATVASIAPSVPSETLPVVYTAMHGVGASTFFRTVKAAGFPAVLPVLEQTQPDPAFPTVAFPNPEEKGALDLSIATAKQHSAALIIAHDPDADRLALALPVDGDYISLTGNQVGAILGWHCALRARAEGRHGALANSLVSSPVLGKIAQHFGLSHHETLTGFKYVSRVPGLIFGFEEALGYLATPDVTSDKDGISAGLIAIDLVYSLAREGQTLWDYLETIEHTVGSFASNQITLTLTREEKRLSLPEQLRATPLRAIGSQQITRFDDFREGIDEYPLQDILRYYLNNGSRVIIRPSGTEPKLKIYFDTEGSNRWEAETALALLEGDFRDFLISNHWELDT